MHPTRQSQPLQPGAEGHLAILALVLGVVLVGIASVFPLNSLDIWWHLKTGENILATGTVPHRDIFTYTANGRTWITHEWLSGILFFGIYTLGGPNLLVLFKALLTSAAMSLGAAAGLVGNGGRQRLPGVAVGVLLGGLLLAQRAYARPHLITAVFLAATLLLLRLETTTPKGRRFWAMVPLFVLWANLHSGFVLGLALIVLYWLGEAFGIKLGWNASNLAEKRSFEPVDWRGRLVVLGATVLGTLLNPHHLHAFLYPFNLLGREEVRDHIIELRSVFHPAFSGALFLKVLVATGLVLLVALISARRNWCLAVLVPGAVFGLIALNSMRGLTEFAVLVPAIIGLHGVRLARHRRVALATMAAVILLAITVGVKLQRQGMPLGSDTYQSPGFGVNRDQYPAGAVSFFQETQPSGRLFNILGFGGYLIHELWPQYQVFIDGRLDVFPAGFLDSYGNLMRTGVGWDQLCRRYGITMAIVNYNPHPTQTGGLRDRLWDDPEWACVFFGDNEMVFARDVPENQAMLACYTCPLNPTLPSAAAIWNFAVQAPAGQRDQAVSAMQAMLEISPDEKKTLVALGLILTASDQSSEGARYLRHAVKLGPESTSTRLLLADVLSRDQAFAEAEAEISQVLLREPDSVEARIIQADLERRQGDLEKARQTLVEAETIDPRNYFVHLRLGDLYRSLGDRASAIRHFKRALQIRPGDPTAKHFLEAARGLDEKP
jgi:Flp pilus assembly protein TadD